VHFANQADAAKHKRTYLMVFGALAVLTVITVAVAKVHLAMPLAVTVAMVVALTKGSLVASVFMHLSTERKALFSVLILCVFFFAVLMTLPVLTTHESVGLVTQKYQPMHGPSHGAAEGGHSDGAAGHSESSSGAAAGKGDGR